MPSSVGLSNSTPSGTPKDTSAPSEDFVYSIPGFHIAFQTIESAYDRLSPALVNRAFLLGDSTCGQIYKIAVNFRKHLFITNYAHDNPSVHPIESRRGLVLVDMKEGVFSSKRKEAPIDICRAKIDELKEICAEFISQYEQEELDRDRVVKKFVLDVLVQALSYYRRQNLLAETRKIEAVEKDVIDTAYRELSLAVVRRAFSLDPIGGGNFHAVVTRFQQNLYSDGTANEVGEIFKHCAAFVATYEKGNVRAVRKCVLGILDQARAYYELRQVKERLHQVRSIENEIIQYALKQFPPLVFHNDIRPYDVDICEIIGQFWTDFSEIFFGRGESQADEIELCAGKWLAICRICYDFILELDEVPIPVPGNLLGRDLEFQKQFQLACMAQNEVMRKCIKNILTDARFFYEKLQHLGMMRLSDVKELDEKQSAVLENNQRISERLKKVKEAPEIAAKIAAIESEISVKLQSECDASYEGIISNLDVLAVLEPEKEFERPPRKAGPETLSSILKAYESTEENSPQSDDEITESSEGELPELPLQSVLKIPLNGTDRLKSIDAILEKFSDLSLYEPVCATKKLARKVIRQFREGLDVQDKHLIQNVYDVCVDFSDQFDGVVTPLLDTSKKAKSDKDPRIQIAIKTKRAIVWNWTLRIFDLAEDFYGEKWLDEIATALGVSYIPEKDYERLKQDLRKIDLAVEKERRQLVGKVKV